MTEIGPQFVACEWGKIRMTSKLYLYDCYRDAGSNTVMVDVLCWKPLEEWDTYVADKPIFDRNGYRWHNIEVPSDAMDRLVVERRGSCVGAFYRGWAIRLGISSWFESRSILEID